MIDVRGLTFRFAGAPRPALQDVHLRIAPGEFVVLTGPSGCGKSTLALALSGYLFRQYAGEAVGEVHVGSIDVRHRPIYEVADIIGLVQQNPENQFCTLTVADELAFGPENCGLPPAEITARAAWALEVVGASHLADRTLATLSGGEKQKVAIAAMLVMRPQVLILDEPTSNLDPTATRAVLDVMDRLRRETGATVIVIEHKTAYLQPFAPRLIAMQAGRIVADSGVSPVALPTLPRPAAARQSEPRAVRAALASLRGVSVVREGREVLRDITLEVRAGEFVVVMGDNGAGKSTLLRVLLGLLKPTAGDVIVCGQDTRRTPVSRLARDAGMVFQNPDHQLFCETVWDEATFAPRNFEDAAGAARAMALLDDYGLTPYRDTHPYRLSYGEKRRLNLSSVLSYAPRLLLLDEVLIGQDPANAAFLMDQLAAFTRQGGAVIAVSHDPLTTEYYADRVLFLEAGRLLLDAPPRVAFARLDVLGRQPYLPLYGDVPEAT